MKLFILFLICVVFYSCTTRQTIDTGDTMEIASATFSSDKGESFNDAVKVGGVSNQREWVAAEYRYISDLHGRRGQDWFLVGKTVIQDRNKIVDVVEIQLSDPADRKLYYFDATAFLLKN